MISKKFLFLPLLVLLICSSESRVYNSRHCKQDNNYDCAGNGYSDSPNDNKSLELIELVSENIDNDNLGIPLTSLIEPQGNDESKREEHIPYSYFKDNLDNEGSGSMTSEFRPVSQLTSNNFEDNTLLNLHENVLKNDPSYNDIKGNSQNRYDIVAPQVIQNSKYHYNVPVDYNTDNFEKHLTNIPGYPQTNSHSTFEYEVPLHLINTKHQQDTSALHITSSDRYNNNIPLNYEEYQNDIKLQQIPVSLLTIPNEEFSYNNPYNNRINNHFYHNPKNLQFSSHGKFVSGVPFYDAKDQGQIPSLQIISSEKLRYNTPSDNDNIINSFYDQGDQITELSLNVLEKELSKDYLYNTNEEYVYPLNIHNSNTKNKQWAYSSIHPHGYDSPFNTHDANYQEYVYPLVIPSQEPKYKSPFNYESYYLNTNPNKFRKLPQSKEYNDPCIDNGIIIDKQCPGLIIPREKFQYRIPFHTYDDKHQENFPSPHLMISEESKYSIPSNNKIHNFNTRQNEIPALSRPIYNNKLNSKIPFNNNVIDKLWDPVSINENYGTPLTNYDVESHKNILAPLVIPIEDSEHYIPSNYVSAFNKEYSIPLDSESAYKKKLNYDSSSNGIQNELANIQAPTRPNYNNLNMTHHNAPPKKQGNTKVNEWILKQIERLTKDKKLVQNGRQNDSNKTLEIKPQLISSDTVSIFNVPTMPDVTKFFLKGLKLRTIPFDNEEKLNKLVAAQSKTEVDFPVQESNFWSKSGASVPETPPGNGKENKVIDDIADNEDDDDHDFRIIGGSAATGSGTPLSNRGRSARVL